MVIRIGIATKIFAFAVSLLGLTVALSIFGTWQTRELHRDSTSIAQVDLPLEEMVKELDSIGLLRRMELSAGLRSCRSPTPTRRRSSGSPRRTKRLTQAGQDHVTRLKEMLQTRGTARAKPTSPTSQRSGRRSTSWSSASLRSSPTCGQRL